MALSQPKQFSGRDLAWEAQARRHIFDSHSPETLLGLCWEPPKEAGEVPVYCHEFHLNPKKRTEDAPCPLCRPTSPKYLHGALVFYPNEQVYRCIGWDCAAKYCNRDDADFAKQTFKAERQREGDFEFLERNLGAVPAMLRHLQALLAASTHADKLRAKLSAAHVKEPLRRVHKNNGGRLRLWELKEVEVYDNATKTLETKEHLVPVDFGALDGEEALSASLATSKALRIMVLRLAPLDRGEGDEAGAWVIENGWDYFADMHRVRRALSDASEYRLKAVAKIQSVLAFFNEQNFQRLATFAQDHRNDIQLYANFKNGRYKIGRVMSEAITIEPDFAILDNLPPWPEFQ